MTITAPISAVELSANRKIGSVSATYAPQSTCPTTCAYLGAGCYAEHGRVGIATRQLAAAADGMALDDIARAEAAAIDRLSGSRPLRLHVVGDCSTDSAANIVSAAADRFTARQGAAVWTYTHAWRTVQRASWQGVSVRASCETLDDVTAARARGYSAAMVVNEHPADGRAYDTAAGRVVPCPEQTRGTSCAECQLCWNHPAAIIAFAAHGPRADMVRAAL